MADVGALMRRFEIAAGEHRRRSPFNTQLLGAIAGRPDIAGILQAAPEEQQLPVLLLAAVHSIVLAEPTTPLADWYPTVRAEPRADDPFPEFARLCLDREDQLRAIVATHATQTNEVGRCALFVPALGLVADEVGPIGLVDIGASAGLNLRLDRYRYEYDIGTVVGPASPVVLPCGVRGEVPVPAEVCVVGARIGVDRSPIDPSDADQVRWLMACVWPDQRDRFERLAAAIELAVAHPAEVLTGDAVALLDRAIGAVGPGGHPTVLTSWVLNYLPLARRTAFLAELDRIGAERDLSWVVLESPGLSRGVPFPGPVADSFLTHLLLVRWRSGVRTVTHLAECHPHGYWMRWA
jgi:hypothetical protein